MLRAVPLPGLRRQRPRQLAPPPANHSPTLGRFLSADPLEFAGRSLNLYAYAGNDPVDYTDPSGTTKKLANALRFVANWPATAPALAWALAMGGSCRMDANLFVVCAGMRWGYGARAGMTVGNVFLTGDPMNKVQSDRGLIGHENRHATQWAALTPSLGPFGLPALYAANEAIGHVLPGPASCWNVFEWHAGFQSGHYYSCRGLGRGP